ncbi:MAG: hypothetical protein KDA20_10400 [Phycisphaerales bacterium]|nr:hypothetical protein [Phycisphaerales bacterium]
MTRTPTALIGLSALALGLGGCSFTGPTFKLDKATSAAHTVGMPIQVATRNGAISIQESAGLAVEITAHLKSKDELRVQQAVIDAVRTTDGTLTIGVTWPDGKWHNNDGCSFEIFVPDANGIVATSSNGSITITGLTGAIDARTSNGRISIASHDGPITVDTSNGRISIVDATGVVNADTSNGSIKVTLADDNPGPVNLDTSNGSVTLEVGPAFQGELVADTSNGRVNFGPFAEHHAVTNMRVSKSDGAATFGTGGERSVIDTSNGSVTIKGKS